MAAATTNGNGGGARDGLFVATLAYLTLPALIFFLGWLRPWLGLFPAALAVAAVVDAWRRARRSSGRLSRGQLALALALAMFWAVASGIGGLNPQTTDYHKHNLVFHDLVANSWPVIYETAPGNPVLTYYLAYYLPAGAIAKLVGPEFTDLLSLAWAWLGIALAFLWFQRLGTPHGTRVLFLVLLIDGFCWLPGLLRMAHGLAWLPENLSPLADSGPSMTIDFWQFGDLWTRLLFLSEIDSLRWVPQHVLPSWLATACVLRTVLERSSARYLVLAHAAAVLWSPFVAVGLVPFTAVALLRSRRDALGWPNLAGAAFAVPIGLYLLGHYPEQYLGILFTAFSTTGDWIKYLAFLLLAIGLLYTAVWAVKRQYDVPRSSVWRLAVLAALVAVGVTFVHMGRYNDWVMRTAMPPMLVLRFTVAITAVGLWRANARRLHRLAFAVFLLLSAERTLKAWVLIPTGMAGGTAANTAVPDEDSEGRSLARLPRSAQWDYAGQYLGDPESFFARHLMAERPER